LLVFCVVHPDDGPDADPAEANQPTPIIVGFSINADEENVVFGTTSPMKFIPFTVPGGKVDGSDCFVLNPEDQAYTWIYGVVALEMAI
jgi:hypothetical protein